MKRERRVLLQPEEIPGSEPLTLARCLAWRPRDWEGAAQWAFDNVSDRLKPGTHVLEIGYGNGLLACYLARHFGVTVTGYDIKDSAQRQATKNALRHGLSGHLDFRVCDSRDPTGIGGTYDMVFMRSVLATVVSDEDFRRWLAWICSVLAADGAVVVLENGVGSIPVRLSRAIRRKLVPVGGYRYFDECRLRDLERTFGSVTARGFGRVAPLFSSWPRVHAWVSTLEGALGPVTMGRSFVVAVVARK